MRSRSNAFDIRIREAELAQQGFKVALSKNERYPAIAVGPFYSQENAADKEQQAGVGVSLPLPFWNRNAGNIENSKAREQQAQASLTTDGARGGTTRHAKRRDISGKARRDRKVDAPTRWQNSARPRNWPIAIIDSVRCPVADYVETQKQYLEAISAFSDAQKDALQAAQELEVFTGRKLYQSEERR